MQKTNIPWCTHTWNPVVGCSKIKDGCKNCYANKLHNQRHKAYLANKRVPPQYAFPFSYVQRLEHRLDEPLKCRAKDAKIFVCSMSDLFHEKVPFEFIDLVYAVIWELNCRYFSNNRIGHTIQLLTKRVERMLDYYKSKPWPRVRKIIKTKYGRNWGAGERACPEILHTGTSISTQTDADKNIPILLQIPAAVRFISLEPMLEAIKDNCKGFPRPQIPFNRKMVGGWFWEEIDQVIIGCESGPKQRPCRIEWMRDIIKQCRVANVPVFVKQVPVNGKCNKNPDDWDEDLRIQEYPNNN